MLHCRRPVLGECFCAYAFASPVLIPDITPLIVSLSLDLDDVQGLATSTILHVTFTWQEFMNGVETNSFDSSGASSGILNLLTTDYSLDRTYVVGWFSFFADGSSTFNSVVIEIRTDGSIAYGLPSTGDPNVAYVCPNLSYSMMPFVSGRDYISYWMDGEFNQLAAGNNFNGPIEQSAGDFDIGFFVDLDVSQWSDLPEPVDFPYIGSGSKCIACSVINACLCAYSVAENRVQTSHNAFTGEVNFDFDFANFVAGIIYSTGNLSEVTIEIDRYIAGNLIDSFGTSMFVGQTVQKVFDDQSSSYQLRMNLRFDDNSLVYVESLHQQTVGIGFTGSLYSNPIPGGHDYTPDCNEIIIESEVTNSWPVIGQGYFDVYDNPVEFGLIFNGDIPILSYVPSINRAIQYLIEVTPGDILNLPPALNNVVSVYVGFASDNCN